MSKGVIPEKARGRPGERIRAVFRFSAGVAARISSGELPLDVFVGDRAIGPLMPVGALDARTISVIQENEFAGDLMLVGRKLLAKGAKLEIAVALFHVAQDLVVAAVLLDDVNHMFKDARLADPLRHRPEWLIRTGELPCFGDLGMCMFARARAVMVASSASFGRGTMETVPK